MKHVYGFMNSYTDKILSTGKFWLPKNLKNRASFEQLGFCITPESGDPYFDQACLPEGWSVLGENYLATFLTDEKNRKRAKVIVCEENPGIFIVDTHIEKQANLLMCTAELFSRFFLKTEESQEKTQVFLRDREHPLFQFKICECTECLIMDDEYYTDVCLLSATEQLTKHYPGWDSPVNWDYNPLLKLF